MTAARAARYEVSNAGDGWQWAFHTQQDAVGWSLSVQSLLMTAAWPSALEEHARTRLRCMPSSPGVRVGFRAGGSGLSLTRPVTLKYESPNPKPWYSILLGPLMHFPCCAMELLHSGTATLAELMGLCQCQGPVGCLLSGAQCWPARS